MTGLKLVDSQVKGSKARLAYQGKSNEFVVVMFAKEGGGWKIGKFGTTTGASLDEAVKSAPPFTLW